MIQVLFLWKKTAREYVFVKFDHERIFRNTYLTEIRRSFAKRVDEPRGEDEAAAIKNCILVNDVTPYL